MSASSLGALSNRSRRCRPAEVAAGAGAKVEVEVEIEVGAEVGAELDFEAK